MNATLFHRGPDSSGEYFTSHLGMAMRRLAIIDIRSGEQPIFNEDRSIAIVYNGEIYNFPELRQELEKLGHHFVTHSDTEVVVHSYEEWGDLALLRFNGMFVFSLWDNQKRRLLIARDRMGKKPLYWHHSNNGLIWGSEIKALLVAPWIERKVNIIALHHYLTLQYVPDPLTIYEGIQSLPAAHKLVIEAGGEPQISPWWQLAYEPKWQISEEEAIEQARSLAQKAVSRRLISEVPLGAFLSGGIDSSIVVALMSDFSSKAVKTFSIGFEEPRYSETGFARQIAERYGTEHHEFIFRPNNLREIIEGVSGSFDQPFADPAALPLYELAHQTRQHVTVALSGDGGDETLAGYRRYALDQVFGYYSNLPAWVTQGFIPKVLGILPEPAWIPEDKNPITGLKRLGQFAGTTQKASIIRWGSYFSHEEKMNLYIEDLRRELEKVRSEDILASAFDRARASSLLDRTLAADHVTYLAGDLLPKTDRVTMAHSLEARAPFLDADWVEWTARLPENFKVRGLKTKYLLKKAFQDKLPMEVAKRGKQGFSLPIGLWLKNELHNWCSDLLIRNPQMGEFFRPGMIEKLLENHSNGTVNIGKRLYTLAIFSYWLSR